MKMSLVKSNIAPKLSQRQKALGQIPKLAHKRFVQETPIDSGRARRSTRLSNDTIVANYPYATRLDNGYSRQAPTGMWEPTLKYIRQLLRNIIGR
jgi:hypothetical protein